MPSTIQVGRHETYLLFPFVEPFYATNQTLAFISDDPSIAEVNQNGKIDGKKKGTTEFNADAMLYNRNTKAIYQIESSNSAIATAKIVDGTLKVTAKKQGNAMFVVVEKVGKEKKELGSFPNFKPFVSKLFNLNMKAGSKLLLMTYHNKT